MKHPHKITTKPWTAGRDEIETIGMAELENQPTEKAAEACMTEKATYLIEDREN